MNITAIRLVIVRANTGFIVMCMVVVRFLEYVHVNSTFLGHDSLPLVLIHTYNCIHMFSACNMFTGNVTSIKYGKSETVIHNGVLFCRK